MNWYGLLGRHLLRIHWKSLASDLCFETASSILSHSIPFVNQRKVGLWCSFLWHTIFLLRLLYAWERSHGANRAIYSRKFIIFYKPSGTSELTERLKVRTIFDHYRSRIILSFCLLSPILIHFCSSLLKERLILLSSLLLVVWVSRH